MFFLPILTSSRDNGMRKLYTHLAPSVLHLYSITLQILKEDMLNEAVEWIDHSGMSGTVIETSTGLL